MCAVDAPRITNTYDGQFSSVLAGSNGTLGFIGDPNPPTNTCLPSPAWNYAILPFWDDLDTTQTADCPVCGIYTSVSGGAPNRIFNIEWKAVRTGSSVPNDFEVRLHEGTNQIDIIYGTINNAATYTVGLQGRLGGPFLQIACFPGDNPVGGGIAEGEMISFVPPGGGPAPTPTACSIQFSDVPEGSTFYAYIRCLACRGVVSGYADGTFRPGG
jgi:hypothetical protein